MPIPKVLVPKRKRTRSLCEDDDSTITALTSPHSSVDESIYSFISKKHILVGIILSIFISGVAFGQLLPSFVNEQEESLKQPTQSPIYMIFDSDAGTFVTMHPTPMANPISAKLDELLGSVHEQLDQLPYLRTLNPDVAALYSPQTLNKLNKKITSSKRFTICINGGSSAAGGGHIQENHRFYARFANTFNIDKIDIIDRSHGSRNSFHSAMMAESFFPSHKPDLFIWEFSINDELGGEATNQFILWMHKLRQFYSGNPPPVFLVYLWSQPFTISNSGVRSTVFEIHQHLGKQFHFCIGHVHLAGYLNLLDFSGRELSRHFLADKHHPNELSHALIAFLMGRVFDSKASASIPESPTKTPYVWECGEEQEKARIRVLFENGMMSKASFTADEPRNNFSDGSNMLFPSKVMASSKNNGTMMTQYYGKIDPVRRDRHRGVELPCCSEGEIVFELSAFIPVTAAQVVLQPQGQGNGGVLEKRRLSFLKGGLHTSRPTKTLLDTIIKVNGVSEHQIVDTDDWGCLLSHPLFRNWILMDGPDFVDQLSFCSQHCDQITTIEQLAIF